MWVGIQGSVQCTACGTGTAANAAVRSTVCDGCGATLELLPEFWRSVLSSAAERGRQLDRNATLPMVMQQAGTEIRLRVSRAPARCMHCAGTWPDVEPGQDHTCPECHADIGVRAPPGAPANPRWLVGEDRALLAGERATTAEPESLACPNCAAPVLADGAARKLACQACDCEVIVPDEMWRRVHQPHAVATWYLWVDGAETAGLHGDIHFGSGLTVGPAGRVYALGSYEGEDVLLAVDTEPPGLAWTAGRPTLGDPTVLGLVGDELWWADLQSPTIRRLDTATGETLGSVTVAGTSGIQAVVDQEDGTVLVHCYPDNRLERISVEGEPRKLWPPSGFFGKLFGWDRGGMAYGGPVARPATVTLGRVGRVHGGGLVLHTRHLGSKIGVLGPDGSLRRTVEVPGLDLVESAPQAGPGGVVVVCGHDGEGGRLTAIHPDGQEVDILASTLEAMMDRGTDAIHPIGAMSAVGPDGDAWITDGSKLARYDADGRLKWQHSPD